MSVFGLWPMARKTPWVGSSLSSPVLRLWSLTGRDPALAAPQDVGHQAVPDPGDLGVGEGAVLHDLRGPQLVAAVDDRHLAGELGEVGRLLHRRVAAADDDDLLVAEEEAVAGGAGRDAVAHELGLGAQPDELGRGAGGDDHGAGAVGRLVGADGEGPAVEVDLDDLLPLRQRPEAARLVAHLLHQLGAHDPLGEAGVVLDVGGDGELPARLVAFEHQGRQVGAGRVERGGQPGGAGAEDDDAVIWGATAARHWPSRTWCLLGAGVGAQGREDRPDGPPAVYQRGSRPSGPHPATARAGGALPARR